MIYEKKRVKLTESLSFERAEQKPAHKKATEVVFNATKDDDDLLEKKSVIFC